MKQNIQPCATYVIIYDTYERSESISVTCGPFFSMSCRSDRAGQHIPSGYQTGGSGLPALLFSIRWVKSF